MSKQSGQVLMEWGQRGAESICRDAALAVVVDVLSFTTTLTIGMDIGAEIYPYPYKDESARDFARQHDAVLAEGRFESRNHAGAGAAVSLSPASMRAATGLVRIVLPSPNGSALARLLHDRGVVVIGAALRNRLAVARWITGWLADRPGQAIAVVAAGERWADDSLRPSVEDLWGAGAVIAALADMGLADTGLAGIGLADTGLPDTGQTGLTPEARTAAAAFRSVAGELPAELAACASGQELIQAGFAADVVIAAELDTSASVPVLSGERFVNAR